MSDSRKSILVLNDYCKLEIIKYIISDCELRDKFQSNRMKYLDLVSLALVHEDLEAVLELYHNDLYKDLEFLFVANRESLEIDFAQLLATHKGKAGDTFWRFFDDAIRENSKVKKVRLRFKPEHFQPDFLDHFQMIKCALEKKRSLCDVVIALNGYSLDDLSNFGHIRKLSLDVRMSAEALATICKSNPKLYFLRFMSTEIPGRLSDIVPHCRRLRYLEFVAKPDVDGAEYAPLAQLPNLEKMTIYGVFKNGSQLTMFEAIQKWQRSETNNLIVSFGDDLPHLSSVAIVRNNAFQTLELYKGLQGIQIRASYKFMDISKDISLAIITLIDARLRIDSTELAIYTCLTSATDINELISLLKQFNIETLIYRKGNSFYALPLEISKSELVPIEINTREIVDFTSLALLKMWELVEETE